MKNNVAIKIENLSKQYRLGVVGTGTISHDLNRWWSVSVMGREDPYLKLSDYNDRRSSKKSEYVWALKNINLEIIKGDVVGVIGNNGAGKSTLLKILSRVTSPTTGSIKYGGRMASLLEVGTGFHPEMTGRENIFMNGAILGMTRNEISRKFDEIVAFAGVEKYIDTPVKRYSSGMTVRLGFSVAAHLEPDILVVDEVLAVGDAEFQKKAIGKIKDVSNSDGRTVLFVSHNMLAIKNLCNKGVLLSNGEVVYNGNSAIAVSTYQLQNTNTARNTFIFPDDYLYNNQNIKLLNINVEAIAGESITVESGFRIKLRFFNKKPNINLAVSINIFSKDDIHLIESPCFISPNSDAETTEYEIVQDFPGYMLNSDTYNVGVLFGENQQVVLLNNNQVLGFKIEDSIYNRGLNFNRFPGLLRPQVKSIFTKGL